MDEVFKMNRSHEGFDLVMKCVAAVRRGDVSGLTKTSFEKALDAVAEAYAAESGMSFAAAASAILSTPTGAELYAGYNAAHAAEAPGPVQKSDPGPRSWQKIQAAADALRKERGGTLTKERAVCEVLMEQPDLYDAYLQETEADRRMHDTNDAA